ncbi:hypothetical protein Patl1_26318 [Pistacia atlantica]|uniref:Uncharacterized protein n=1 Tax=Pistacia atlantica TaxID=434234 RepID=A0ACC1B383_9ROSI|nr:hypothetical protein Patl1_26318 [Pistacia atlantica]
MDTFKQDKPDSHDKLVGEHWRCMHKLQTRRRQMKKFSMRIEND